MICMLIDITNLDEACPLRVNCILLYCFFIKIKKKIMTMTYNDHWLSFGGKSCATFRNSPEGWFHIMWSFFIEFKIITCNWNGYEHWLSYLGKSGEIFTLNKFPWSYVFHVRLMNNECMQDMKFCFSVLSFETCT